jgi:hypothetical protein
MLKFTARTGSGELYGFGLTDENVGRLVGGRPIQIDLADMGGPPVSILLLYGSTEEALFADLKAAGLLDPRQTTMDPCNCAKCVAERERAASGAESAEAEEEYEQVFQGSIRIDAATGRERAIGFKNLNPEFVPALAAGFVVGWLEMKRNQEILAKLQEALRGEVDPARRVDLMRDLVALHATEIGGARTLAEAGHSVTEADWAMVEERLVSRDGAREREWVRKGGDR